MACDCCYCKAQRKECKERKQSMKCFTKGCPGHYERTSRKDGGTNAWGMQIGLTIYECPICKSEGV